MKADNDFTDQLEQVLQALPKGLRTDGVLSLIEISLKEDFFSYGKGALTDLPAQDITSAATLASIGPTTGRIFTKMAGVVAGLPIAEAVFKIIDPGIEYQHAVSDGDHLTKGQDLATVHGPAISLMAAERTAMNFLGRLSGIATLTRKFVDSVAHTQAVILDTRKTAPGYRLLDKYAVQMGGGENHRMGLYDMVLIKNNHIDAVGGIEVAVEQIRGRYGDRYKIEVEVRSLDELKIALGLNPDRIMLDNMDLQTIRKAVEIARDRIPLEVSGNVSLENVGEIAATGVTFISVGALTHSAPALDVSLHTDIPSNMHVNMGQT
jgi:nicotinate-nucleotide pyrophosphorylase (carboxylating)